MFPEVGFISLIVALLALWIVYTEYRRNSHVLIKLIDCSCSNRQSIFENREQVFRHFRVCLQNHGVPLYNLSAVLKFIDENELGTVTLELKRVGSKENRQEVFARGMIAEFSLKSYQLSHGDPSFLLGLKDVAKQDARLCLYSGGYLACTFPVGGIAEQVKASWNEFAFEVNNRLQQEIVNGADYGPVASRYEVCPRLPVISSNLRDFIEYTQQEAQEAG